MIQKPTVSLMADEDEDDDDDDDDSGDEDEITNDISIIIKSNAAQTNPGITPSVRSDQKKLTRKETILLTYLTPLSDFFKKKKIIIPFYFS